MVDNFDAFSEELRRYQGRDIVPTSHGDYLDRAVRSLAKEIGLQIPIELGNSSAVKVRAHIPFHWIANGFEYNSILPGR